MDDLIGKLLKANNVPDNPTGRAIYKKMLEGVDYDDDDDIQDYKKPWVGLTAQERNDCLVQADPCECLADPEAHQLMVEVEAKLRSKNA
jgi:hypothetical protein